MALSSASRNEGCAPGARDSGGEENPSLTSCEASSLRRTLRRRMSWQVFTRMRNVQVTKEDCPRKLAMLRCTFRNVSCTASSASFCVPSRLRARFFMRAPCKWYSRSYARKSPRWHAAASAKSSGCAPISPADVLFEDAALADGSNSEGCTRDSPWHSNGEILCPAASASPTDAMCFSHGIDDGERANV